ncbi:hypothetical protein SDC9_119716 [bioreactor metagenome]|uniref:Uncharacterized protein n=1 Tax=bioreactor metagenome TaxID=1076179 RepID=A0A645C4P9_9ZZZZ
MLAADKRDRRAKEGHPDQDRLADLRAPGDGLAEDIARDHFQQHHRKDGDHA